MSSIYTGRARTMTGLAALLVILVLGASACQSSTPKVVIKAAPHPLRFVAITDEQVLGFFWSEVERGIEQAASETGVTVVYRSPSPFTVAAMSQLIDQAVSNKTDGLVVAIPDCNGLAPALKRAVLVGIPVVSIDSASNCSSQLSLFNAVGQDGYQTGLESGQRFVAHGDRHVLCVNEELGNPDFDSRCSGVSAALTQAQGRTDVLSIDPQNPAATQQILTMLNRDPSIDAVMTLSPAGASLATAAIQQSRRAAHITLATFDVSSSIFQEIQQHFIFFAVDQQPYAQGFVAVDLLSHAKKHLQTAVPSVKTAAPSFVDITNVQTFESGSSSTLP